MTREPLPPRPFSPFLRLLLGASVTALVGEWTRFQVDLAWAALPVGFGGVLTLASVGRGMRARRAWRRTAVAHAQADADARDATTDLPLPQGQPSALEVGPPRSVEARRDDAAPPAPPADALAGAVLTREQDEGPATDEARPVRSDRRTRAQDAVGRD